MNIKTYISVLTAISLFILYYNSFAQTNFNFAYDAAGNQTQRTYLVMLRSAKINVNNSAVDSSNIIVQAEKIKVTIYPNPTRGELKIDINGIDGSTSVDLRLFNPTGQLLWKQKAKRGLTIIDMRDFPSGWYLLHVLKEDEKLNFKIVKE